MDKEEILDNLKKGRNLLNKRFLDKEDEHGILKENTGLDNLFGRDPMQYMRLRGTEKSFFIHQKCCELYKKKTNGEYKLETTGTLILTTRRLTFCQFSKRGAALDRGDNAYKAYRQSLAGFDPSRGKKEDWIIFSYPSYRLCKNKIKNFSGPKVSSYQKDIQKACGEDWVVKELVLEDQEIKFVFSVEINKSLEDQSIDRKKGIQLYQVDGVNNLFSMKLEHYMTYMKFFYQDTELYPSWDFSRDENDEPFENDFLSTKERNQLKKRIESENSKYSFEYQGKTWFGAVKKIIKKEDDESNSEFAKLKIKENFSKSKNTKNIPPKPNAVEKMIPEEDNSDVSSMSEELEKLASLKEKGIITDEEFSAAKAKILNS